MPAQENIGSVSGRLFLATLLFRLGDQTCDRQHPLVIEDDRLNRDLISKVLRIDGHGVVEACDAMAALEVASNDALRSGDYRFCDAKVNGLKFVKQLHALQRRLPIIFITGYHSTISGNTVFGDVAEILPKSFELNVLGSTVQRLLRGSITC